METMVGFVGDFGELARFYDTDLIVRREEVVVSFGYQETRHK